MNEQSIAFLLPDPIKVPFDQDSYGANISNFSHMSLSLVRSYGGERYEKRDLQIRVRQRFGELQAIDEKHGRVPWHVVDAAQSIEQVTEELVSIVTKTVKKVEEGAPLNRMFSEGVYELPDVSADECK